MLPFRGKRDVLFAAAGRVAQALRCAVGEPMLLIERIFICQDGKKIGYSVQFSWGQFGKLQGRSGHHI